MLFSHKIINIYGRGLKFFTPHALILELSLGGSCISLGIHDIVLACNLGNALLDGACLNRRGCSFVVPPSVSPIIGR